MGLLLPHGGYPLLPATLSMMAWITSLSQDGCDFSRLTGPAVILLTGTDYYPYVELGFQWYRVPAFYRDYDEWIVRYGDERLAYHSGTGFDDGQDLNLDSDFFWNIGKWMHFGGTVLGGSGCFFIWLSASCMTFTRRSWFLGAIQIAFAALLHFLSLFWFFNVLCTIEGSTCHFFYGSKSSLLSASLYLVAFVTIMLKFPEPKVMKIVKKEIESDLQRYERFSLRHVPTDYDSSSYYSNHVGASEHKIIDRDYKYGSK